MAIQVASGAPWPADPAQMRAHLRDRGAFAVLLRDPDGSAIATATAGPILSRCEQHGRHVGVWTLPGGRGAGAGRSVWTALVDHLAGGRVTLLRTTVVAADADALRFATRRGFWEVNRDQELVLDLAAARTRSAPTPPSGIAVVSLAERPGLLHDLPAAEARIVRDIPNIGDVPFVADVAAWRERFRDGTHPPETVLVALAGDRIAGLAYLWVTPDGREGLHDLTGTMPGWRGRGVATALKHEMAVRAARHGRDVLRATNDLTNAPMRAVNARLGYVPTRVLVSLSATAPFVRTVPPQA